MEKFFINFAFVLLYIESNLYISLMKTKTNYEKHICKTITQNKVSVISKQIPCMTNKILRTL